MSPYTLRQYTAIQAFASESIEGVSWQQIANAVGAQFESEQDAVNAAGILLAMRYLAPVSFPLSADGKVCLMPDRVIATKDGIDNLRELRALSEIFRRKGRRHRFDQLPPCRAAVDGSEMAESLKNLSFFKIADVESGGDQSDSGDDRIESPGGA